MRNNDTKPGLQPRRLDWIEHDAKGRSLDLQNNHDASPAHGRAEDGPHDSLAPYDRHSASPIHRLPLEIFGNVLVEVITLREVNQPTRRLQVLAAVARRWRDVILATPRLWCRITGSMSPTEVEWVIQRSRTLPLEIEIVVKQPTWIGGERLDMAQIGRESHRWRALTLLGGTNLPDAIRQGLQGATPALEYLRLLGGCNFDPTDRIGLGEGAQFRSVELYKVGLSWDSPRLSGLVNLSIFGVEGPTTRSLVAILASCPGLRSLVLWDLELPPSTEEEDEAGLPHVDLTELTDVTLHRIPDHTFTCLMNVLPWHTCRIQRLKVDLMANVFDQSRPDFLKCIANIVIRDPPVHVRLVSGFLSITTDHRQSKDVPGGVPSFGLQIDIPSSDDLGLSLIQQLRPSFFNGARHVPTKLSVNNELLYRGQEALRTFFAIGGPGTDEIIVRESFKWRMSKVILQLATRGHAEDGREVWLCPNLRTISIPRKPTEQDAAYWTKLAEPRWVPYQGTSEDAELMEVCVDSVPVLRWSKVATS